MYVFGDFYLGKDAVFDNKGLLCFSDRYGEINVHTEEKTRTIIIPANYGPVYSMTGAILFGTGTLVTATGSRIEIYTPSVGNVCTLP